MSFRTLGEVQTSGTNLQTIHSSAQPNSFISLQFPHFSEAVIDPYFHVAMLAFCCNPFLMALAVFFFHEFFCTHMFIAPTLIASRHLELQTEMPVPNNPAFIAVEPYFKTSEKLISVISPPFPVRNASKTCRLFSLCYLAFQQFNPSLGINYLT